MHNRPRPPLGNVTAVLVVVALAELILNRLIGRLFLSHAGCQKLLPCLVARSGPFFLYLAGLLAIGLLVVSIVRHLARGELFPRGVRFTVAALSFVFCLLVASALFMGRMPDRYDTHLETSFGFVVALLLMSVAGQALPWRTKLGVVMLGLPALAHVAAAVSDRAGWLTTGPVTPARLSIAGEAMLLLACAVSPVVLLPERPSRARLGAALAFAAGVSGFFFVALLGRTDLLQTAALYTVHVELPHALTWAGLAYVLALFGFTTSAALLLSGTGGTRLAGYGLALLALGGYQTSSPVELAEGLVGLLALSSGLLRASQSAVRSGAQPGKGVGARSLPEAIGAALSSGSEGAGPEATIETSGESDARRTSIGAVRRGFPVRVELVGSEASPREIVIAVGVRPTRPPDGVIEPHESWLARSPEDRPSLPRTKTGDRTFDRKLIVQGETPIAADAALRRRLLKVVEGRVCLWREGAAEYVVRSPKPAARVAPAKVAEATDLLAEVVRAGGGAA